MTQPVALFATCVGSLLAGRAVEAAHDLLARAGFAVELPEQACCGQPAHNSGYETAARDMALATVEALRPFARVVVPSASCCGMIRNHYPALFTPGSAEHAAARALAEKTFELFDFLHRAGWRPAPDMARGATALWHDSCASLRETGTAAAAVSLLRQAGARIIVPDEDTRQECCGFGGTFSVKLPELSGEIGRRKIAALLTTAREAHAGERNAPPYVVVGQDAACLAHLQAVAESAGAALVMRHAAELLAE